MNGPTDGASDAHPAPECLATLLAELHELQRALPPTARDHLARLLDPGRLSYDSGIEPGRVAELLAGADPDTGGPQAAAQAPYLARLLFLRATRLKRPASRRARGRSQRPYTYSEIARGSGLSRQTVHYVFTEGRRTSPENVAGMERFFGALPGFCFYTESEALAARLRPVVDRLRVLRTVTDAYEQEASAARTRRGEPPGDGGPLTEMDEILSAVIDDARRR
ncbi:hypothetical protein [Streptomyces sp. NPDC000983]|uniref:hypothetical protein n=1 Tax=Streptomyces sp. NPDC000983 TaxID=3154373 RepID=UPI003332CA29